MTVRRQTNITNATTMPHVADEQPAEAPLLATTSYTDMLNDDARNRAYRRAIEAAMATLGGNDKLVLDIGTGTGLLAMMAARSMRAANHAHNIAVVGCEVHPATAALARRIVAANDLADVVRIVNARSNDVDVGDGRCLVTRVLTSKHYP